jgi:UDP-N-acetyl-D-mannosaminuronic acid dehydrogenase
LEIYADDVKCSHGSTTGQLDDEAIFYLRARGLSERSARQLMISAFIGEVIEKIKNVALKFELDYGKKPKIAAMGLAFKPNIDDLRESPSLYVARSLKMQNFDVVAVEPNIDKFDEMPLLSPEKAVNEADIIAFLVGHQEFKNLKISDKKTVFDFVNVSGK